MRDRSEVIVENKEEIKEKVIARLRKSAEIIIYIGKGKKYRTEDLIREVENNTPLGQQIINALT